MSAATNAAVATASATPVSNASAARRVLNRVPEVTMWFWIIKVLATTVGETAADYVNDTLGFGINNTMLLMGALLVVVGAVQFAFRRYVPTVYWATVVLISIVGTLVTDKIHDDFGVSNTIIAPVFAALLAATFTCWYLAERTLSIHTVFTARRERFYWLAVLWTFALGTAAGDLFAESLNLGYFTSAAIFGAAILAVAGLHAVRIVGPVLAFWIAYILTRPFGASIGDGLSQRDLDGLGIGTTMTSFLFLAVIAAVVAYLTISRVDREDTIIDVAGTEHGEFEADGVGSMLGHAHPAE